MARPEIDNFVNLDEPVSKRQLMTSIGTMHGLYEVKIKPKRDTRSARANRFYWSCVVKPFHDFMREQHPEITDPEQSHIELKRQILGTMPIKSGDVVFRVVKTTHDMDSATFADYVDRARAWLLNAVGIVTPEPGEVGMEYREKVRQQ